MTAAQNLWQRGIPAPIIKRQVNHRNLAEIRTCPRCGKEVQPDEDKHVKIKASGKRCWYHRSCWDGMFIDA